MPAFIDISNQRFGRLYTIEFLPKQKWLCSCDCGKRVKVLGHSLTSGHTTSCGCLIRERINKIDPIYNRWRAIISRCTNPNSTNFRYYGKRGIKVCDRWRTFENFRADIIAQIGPLQDNKLTLDRINNNGNYEPGNIRWATHSEQMRNRRPRGHTFPMPASK